MNTAPSSSAKKPAPRIRFDRQPDHAPHRRGFQPFIGSTASHQSPNPLDRTGGVMGNVETVKVVLH